MTLLSAANEVCDIVSLDRFASLVGVHDEAAYNMLAIANEAGQEIARRADWQAMLRTAAIAASPANLPADFQRVASAGAVRAADGSPIRPVIDAGQWALIQTVASTTAFYFIRGNQIRFSPASAAAGAIVDYFSRNWALNVATPIEAFNADDNTTIFPERLLAKNMIWRWKRQKGLAYDDNLAEFEADLAQEIAADGGVM
jgi:hypothetical protein